MSIYFHIPLTEVYEVNSLKLGTKKALFICINGTSLVLIMSTGLHIMSLNFKVKFKFHG